MEYKHYDETTLKRIQTTELEILEEFIRICDKYEIPYFTLFGTTIGVARHKGFIPWDDDLDVGLLRKDYERFMEVAPKEVGDRFGFMGADCPDIYYNLITKMYKKNTLFTSNYDHGRYAMGINIDLFVYDNIPHDPAKRKKQIQKSVFFRYLQLVRNVNLYKYIQVSQGRLLTRLLCGGMHCLLRLLHVPSSWICKQWKKNATQYQGKTSYVTQLAVEEEEESTIALRELFPLREMPFEHLTVKVPHNYDAILKRMYGDYMQLPPEEQRRSHFPYILQFEGEKPIHGDTIQRI